PASPGGRDTEDSTLEVSVLKRLNMPIDEDDVDDLVAHVAGANANAGGRAGAALELHVEIRGVDQPILFGFVQAADHVEAFPPGTIQAAIRAGVDVVRRGRRGGIVDGVGGGVIEVRLV